MQSNNNGLGLDSVTFMKNSMDIILSVVNVVQFAVNGQCNEYNEYSSYTPFTAVGKPVFNTPIQRRTRTLVSGGSYAGQLDRRTCLQS